TSRRIKRMAYRSIPVHTLQNVRPVICLFMVYDFDVLRTLRGRPTFRSLTVSRSFGSISHTFPTFIAFKRPLPIIARILLGDTFKRLAASVVLMIFMAQSIAFCENCAVAQQFS